MTSPFEIAATEQDREEVVRRYVDLEITAEEAADRLGPGTAVVEVILEAKRRFGRLPDRRDAFTENEYRRALIGLGLQAPESPVVGSSAKLPSRPRRP